MKIRKKVQKVTVEEEYEQSNRVDVVALLNKVNFSPDNVVMEAAVNPTLFVKAISYRLQCLETKTRTDMAHKRLRAETELDIRNKARASAEKVTENHVSAKVLLNKEVETAAREAERASTYDEYSKLVVEAFRMRRDSLKIVADMTRQEMNVGRGMDVEELNATREKLKQRFPG